METIDRRPRYLWFKLAILAGAALGILLLAQTFLTYRYVSDNLVRLEARRHADRTLRALETAAQVAGTTDPANLGPVLDAIRLEAADRVAWISLLGPSGESVAASGPAPSRSLSGDDVRRLVEERGTLTVEQTDDRELLVAVLLCRCGRPPGGGGNATPDRSIPPSGAASPGAPDVRSGAPRGPIFAEIAVYRDGISASFRGLQRQVIVTSLAALALLAAMVMIWARFRPYLQGRLLEHQLAVARGVQRDLLPQGGRSLPGVGVGAACVPASQVGGDFYDTVPLDSRRSAFLVGDVSGHGIPAALLMGLIHGAMTAREWTDPDGNRPRAAARLNDLLLAKSSAERFASLFWCEYDADARLLRYVNAGHVPPILLRRATGQLSLVERLSEGGPVLGVLPGASYEQGEVRVEPGDLLVIVSDGVVEAGDGREEFGEGRLVEAIRGEWGRSAPAICDAVLARVRAFEGGRPSRDDLTLLILDFGAVPEEAGQPAPSDGIDWMTSAPQVQAT